MKIASTPTNSEEVTHSRSQKFADPLPADTARGTKAKDLYRYGWREIPRALPNGKKIYERIPLTLEDIIHPQVGDFRIQSAKHEQICTYLRILLREHLANDPTTIVLGDVLVDWATDEMRGHGPDVAIIFNVQQKQNWSTFHEAEEGTKPSLIIEVTAPFTYSVDLETKVAHYAEVGVEWYVIVDIVIRRGMPAKRLLGYQLTEDGYKQFEPNEKGWLWLAPVNLWLGWRGEDIACYDVAGNLVEIGNSRVIEAQARVAAEQSMQRNNAPMKKPKPVQRQNNAPMMKNNVRTRQNNAPMMKPESANNLRQNCVVYAVRPTPNKDSHRIPKEGKRLSLPSFHASTLPIPCVLF